MAQFARPISDVSLGGWSGPAWSAIDEAVASDADSTSSPTAPSNATLEVALGAVEDPQVSTGHVVRYRLQKDAANGAQINVTVALMQGAVQIASWSHTNIANGFTTITQTLTGPQADAISDYSNLRLRFTANQV